MGVLLLPLQVQWDVLYFLCRAGGWNRMRPGVETTHALFARFVKIAGSKLNTKSSKTWWAGCFVGWVETKHRRIPKPNVSVQVPWIPDVNHLRLLCSPANKCCPWYFDPLPLPRLLPAFECGPWVIGEALVWKPSESQGAPLALQPAWAWKRNQGVVMGWELWGWTLQIHRCEVLLEK